MGRRFESCRAHHIAMKIQWPPFRGGHCSSCGWDVGPGPGFYVPPVSDPDKPSKARLPQSPSRSVLTEITPNVPARLLPGPAVKNNWFTAPFLPAPSPKPIPHNWSIEITLPFASFTFPTNFPSAALKALIVPWSVLFEINSVLLSIPKFLGATAIPQG